MDERERRAHISRRLKAARWLAGGMDERGAVRALSSGELVERDAMIDYGISRNRIEEIEQCKARVTRGDLDALVDAMRLPDDWFAGLYPAEAMRDEVARDSLGEAFLEVADARLERADRVSRRFAAAVRAEAQRTRERPQEGAGAHDDGDAQDAAL